METAEKASDLEKPHPRYTKAILSLALNFVMAPLLILLNKTVYIMYGFPTITLIFVHFVCTTVGMLACRCLGKYCISNNINGVQIDHPYMYVHIHSRIDNTS